MKRPFGISAGVHLAALLILIIGLPSFMRDEVITPTTLIPVDIVNISDVTNTRVSEKPDPKPTPAPTKTEPPKPQPQEQKPEEKKQEAKEKPAEKPADDKAEIIPDKTKPKEKPKDEPKKPEPPKKDDKKKDEESKTNLQAVLKNVAKLKETAPTAPTPNPAAEPDDKPVNTQEVPSLGAQLSISEMDALRRQIAQCWNVPVGARGIENMVVELYIEVNEDRTVRKVEVTDKARYMTDSFFRTVAESAVRALYNPRCTPLMVPPEKFKDWQKIRMNFDPREMVN